MHSEAFGLPILAIILDNTEAVNPQVPLPQFTRNSHRILERLRQVAELDKLHPFSNVFFCCFNHGACTPAVTQADIVDVAVARFDQADIAPIWDSRLASL